MEAVVTPAPGFSYGLGLQKLRAQCGAVWGHTGASPGYVANALNSKDGNRQIVVLVNATRRLALRSRQRLPVLPAPEAGSRRGRPLDPNRVLPLAGARERDSRHHARATGRPRCRPANSPFGAARRFLDGRRLSPSAGR